MCLNGGQVVAERRQKWSGRADGLRSVKINIKWGSKVKAGWFMAGWGIKDSREKFTS